MKTELGGTSLELYGKKQTLRQGRKLYFHLVCQMTLSGRQKLKIWPGEPGDGSLANATPGKSEHERTAMDELEKRLKKFDSKKIPRVDWLDQLVGKAIADIQAEALAKHDLSLFVMLQEFPHPVAYYEPVFVNNAAVFPLVYVRVSRSRHRWRR